MHESGFWYPIRVATNMEFVRCMKIAQVDVADDLASVNLLEIGKHNRGDILDPSIVQATASITTQIGSVEHTPDPAVVECSAASSVSVRTTGYGALDNPSCVILEQQGKM